MSVDIDTPLDPIHFVRSPADADRADKLDRILKTLIEAVVEYRDAQSSYYAGVRGFGRTMPTHDDPKTQRMQEASARLSAAMQAASEFGIKAPRYTSLEAIRRDDGATSFVTTLDTDRADLVAFSDMLVYVDGRLMRTCGAAGAPPYRKGSTFVLACRDI